MKRLATEMPQPARAFSWLFPAFFLVSLPIYVLSGKFWPVRLALGVSAVFLLLFGFCVFRDINNAATSWSRMYKESRGISPEHFIFADVSTLKGMGFIYMLMGVFWLGLAIFAM
ncbi:hypothetical protein ACX801_08005 [Arthrobacter bambusae]